MLKGALKAVACRLWCDFIFAQTTRAHQLCRALTELEKIIHPEFTRKKPGP